MKRLVSLLIFAICAMTANAADITEEVVYAHRDSLDIYGLMYKPAGQTNLPIVICSHSSSLTHKDSSAGICSLLLRFLRWQQREPQRWQHRQHDSVHRG